MHFLDGQNTIELNIRSVIVNVDNRYHWHSYIADFSNLGILLCNHIFDVGLNFITIANNSCYYKTGKKRPL